MGKIAYYSKNNLEKLYLNIVEGYRCTNNCIFCNKNLLESAVENDLFIKEKPSNEAIIREIENEMNKNKIKEIIFCGIAEPLIHLDTILYLIKEIKNKYDVKVRLNTNGQAYLIYPERKVAEELKKTGLDSISISLNAISKEDYNHLHNPKLNKDRAFNSVLEFAKDCEKQKIETGVSFIRFKDIDEKKILEFAESIGLKKEQVRFREHLS